MKISKKSISIVFTLLITVLSFLFMVNVYAQDETVTPQQIDKIRDNCVSVKNTLGQLHASDALLRVNRGQTYELMSTKLMNGFNGRLSSNGLSNTQLSVITKSYNTTLNVFRQDYRLYEEQLTLAIGVDCQKRPAAFYEAVVKSRDKRSRVHADITKLNQYVDEYQSALIQFEKNYNSPSESGN